MSVRGIRKYKDAPTYKPKQEFKKLEYVFIN